MSDNYAGRDRREQKEAAIVISGSRINLATMMTLFSVLVGALIWGVRMDSDIKDLSSRCVKNEAHIQDLRGDSNTMNTNLEKLTVVIDHLLEEVKELQAQKRGD